MLMHSSMAPGRSAVLSIAARRCMLPAPSVGAASGIGNRPAIQRGGAKTVAIPGMQQPARARRHYQRSSLSEQRGQRAQSVCATIPCLCYACDHQSAHRPLQSCCARPEQCLTICCRACMGYASQHHIWGPSALRQSRHVGDRFSPTPDNASAGAQTPAPRVKSCPQCRHAVCTAL
jgi:hypothetical protein